MSNKTESKAAETDAAKPKSKTSKNAKSKVAVKDTFDRKEMTRAVAVVAEVFRSNVTGFGIEKQSAMTFDGKYLRANTYAAAIKFPFESKFQASVSGQTLAKIVNALENHGADDIGVFHKNGTMTISSGRSSVEMVVFPTDADEVANMTGAAKLEVDAKTRSKIVLAITQALRAAGTNDIRSYLNGVHFAVEDGKLIIAGTDGLALCRVNTGIEGADDFHRLSLTRDTAESFIATAGRTAGAFDTMLMTRHENNKPALFGWQFENGAEFCATALETPDTLDFVGAMAKLKGHNPNKLPSVPTPDGLIDALDAGKIAATSGGSAQFVVKDGVMSVQTGDINNGFIYRTTDIATEIKDTESAYRLDLLLRVSKNPAKQILFLEECPLYIGDVDMYDNKAVGAQTFLMPMRV